ncbi:MAG: dihydropteroate synthase [Fimbriimonadaceae bacterium]|nr:dihydropteroate synthase [Fimbriimonadaceae bacterium]
MSLQIPPDRPLLMGIVNVTPDSFSDGGSYADAPSAAARGLALIAEGADLIDVGGESTRPGAEPVPFEEELRRVLPVVEALARQSVTVAIDTSKSVVAKSCLEAGAKVVNDVRALSDPAMSEVCAEFGCGVCLMHMQNDPATMQIEPRYGDVVREVRDFLGERAESARRAGVAEENIWIDPGFGFGKTVEHNLALLRGLPAICGLGYPVLVGLSRKSFLGRIAGGDTPLPIREREGVTLAAQALAQMGGAKVIRTHEITEAVRVARLISAFQLLP